MKIPVPLQKIPKSWIKYHIVLKRGWFPWSQPGAWWRYNMNSHYWPFMQGNNCSPVVSANRGPAMQSFGVFFALDKLLNNRLNCWCVGAPWRSCDINVMWLPTAIGIWHKAINNWYYPLCWGCSPRGQHIIVLFTTLRSIGHIAQMVITGTVTCTLPITWWRHQMEIFSALLALCAGNSPVTGELGPRRKASDAELWCFLWSAPE